MDRPSRVFSSPPHLKYEKVSMTYDKFFFSEQKDKRNEDRTIQNLLKTFRLIRNSRKQPVFSKWSAGLSTSESRQVFH